MKTTTAMLAATLAFAAAHATADTVLIGTQNSSILAYNTDTGTVTFRGLCAGPVSALTSIGDTLYIGDEFGKVYSFDLNTNLLVGSFPVSVDAVAMATDGEALLIADTDGEIQRIDPDTGVVLTTVSTSFGAVTSLGAHWGNLYYGALNTIAERVPMEIAFPDNNFELFAACGGAINSMAFSGLNVVLGSLNGSIYRYDEFNGTYANVHSVGVDAVGLAALTGGRLLVADSSGRLIEVNQETGAIIRDINVGEPIGALLALDVGEACPIDLDLSGVLDLGDVQTFIMLAIDGRLGADLDRDGDVDLTDVGMFVSEFTIGCG